MAERIIRARHVVINCGRQGNACNTPTFQPRNDKLDRTIPAKEQQIIDFVSRT